MQLEAITAELLSNYASTTVVEAWGETSIFYNPKQRLPRGVYFATLKNKNGENDKASQLDREGIFRLNIGTSKQKYFDRFGQPPSRPSKGGIIAGPWNFTTLNELTPHPVYGWMSWVSINNPSKTMLHELTPFIDAAYEKAIMSFQKR